MNPMIQIVIIIYLFLIVPFLMGILEASLFRKQKKGISEVFTNGYLLMLAVFWIVSVAMIWKKQPLSILSGTWMLLTLVLSVAAIIVGWRQIREIFKEIKTAQKRERYVLFIVLLASMVISIGFTRPHFADATAEIVDISVKTDSMYAYDEYTGYLSDFAMDGHEFSPIEMLYAVATEITDMQSIVVIYYILPVFLLLFFAFGFWRIGRQLFSEEKNIVRFELAVIAIYWMTTYLEGQSMVTGIFLNSWNGITLLSCVLLPIIWGNCIEWFKNAQKETMTVWHKIEKICMAFVSLLAAQLTYDKGGFYVILMLALCVVVMIVGKGYEYGITSGRFKKRI